MLSTLDALQRYTEERAARSPVIARRVLLRSPGLGAEEAARLARDLPGLPQSYLDVAQHFALGTVELEMAAMRPRNLGGGWLADRLVVANGPDNPVVGFLRDHDLYEVASWETDPIAVVRDHSAQRRPGEVVWVEITSDPSFTVSPAHGRLRHVHAARRPVPPRPGTPGPTLTRSSPASPWTTGKPESRRALGSMVRD